MKIFLSHASQSKPLVRRLTEGLPPHVECWLDQDELAAGQRFGRHIEDGIRLECDFLIAFIDAAALDSEWVHREVAIGLQRHRDLQRPFVLPVLLEDVRERLHEIGLPPQEWLYLDATDRSEPGLDASAAALQAELFKHASVLVERLRDADRRALVDGFTAELAAFEQVAFRWVASMANPIDYIVTVPEAQDHVRECLAAYNAVADRFIPRLPMHRDRLTAGWRDNRLLRKHIAALIDEIEDGVYRGAMFALNEVLQAIHEAMLAEHEGRPSPQALAAADARKTALLAEARKALAAMTEEASELAGNLTSELE